MSDAPYAALCRGCREQRDRKRRLHGEAEGNVYGFPPLDEEGDPREDPTLRPEDDPPPSTECPRCLSAKDRHGDGLHGSAASACPTCGGRLARYNRVTENEEYVAVTFVQRCYRCRPPDSLFGRLLVRVVEVFR